MVNLKVSNLKISNTNKHNVDVFFIILMCADFLLLDQRCILLILALNHVSVLSFTGRAHHSQRAWEISCVS